MRVLSIRPIAAFLAVTAVLVWSQAAPDLVVSKLDVNALNEDSQTLAVSGTMAVTIRNVGGAATAATFKVLVFEDRNRNGQYDPSGDNVVGSALSSGALGV